MSFKEKSFIAFTLIFMSWANAFAGNENGGGGARCKSDFLERLAEIEKLARLNPNLNQEHPYLIDLLKTVSPISNPDFTIVVSESPIQNCPNTAGPMACANPLQNTVTLFCGPLGWDSLSKAERQKHVIHELLWWNPNYDDRNYFYSTTLSQKLLDLSSPATVCERSDSIRNFLVNYFQKPCDQINIYDFGDIENLELDRVSHLKSGDFDGFVSLKSLVLKSDGQLVSVPEDIFDPLVSLVKLTVFGSKIQNVPSGLLKQLLLLKVLYWQSELSSIPEKFFINNLKLEEISLAGNNLNSIPVKLFAKNYRLKELSLSNNKLHELPIDVFNNLFRLQVLSIENNPELHLTSQVFDPIENLKDITFDYSSVSQNASLGFTKIEKIDVRVSRMKYIPNNFLKQFTHLKGAFFDVTQNSEIDHIDEDFIYNHKQLELFGVKGANFETLPLKLVNRNNKLRWIHFVECNLFSLPTGFFVPYGGTPRNNFLFLRNNRLNIVEQERIKKEIDNTVGMVDFSNQK